MNNPVNLELQKLLLEKNIDTPVQATIADLVKWIFKNHNIWIWVACRQLDDESNKIIFIPNGRFIPTEIKNGFEVDCIPYLSKSNPDEAYEAAIEHVLNKLI